MSPGAHRSTNLLLKQKNYYPVSLLSLFPIPGAGGILRLRGSERTFQQKAHKKAEVVANSNFLWLSVTTCVFFT